MAPGPLHPRWRSLFELNTIEECPLTSLFSYSPLHTLHPHALYPHALPTNPFGPSPLRAMSRSSEPLPSELSTSHVRA